MVASRACLGLLCLFACAAASSAGNKVVRYSHDNRREFMNDDRPHLLLFLDEESDSAALVLQALQDASDENWRRLLHIVVPSSQTIPMKVSKYRCEQLKTNHNCSSSVYTRASCRRRSSISTIKTSNTS